MKARVRYKGGECEPLTQIKSIANEMYTWMYMKEKKTDTL